MTVVWSIIWMIAILLISVAIVIYYIMRYDHSFRMIKYIAIPLILVGCTAPVTDPPAHAEIVTYREELHGEVNLYNPDQWMQMYGIYERNRRREIIGTKYD